MYWGEMGGVVGALVSHVLGEMGGVVGALVSHVLGEMGGVVGVSRKIKTILITPACPHTP